MREHTPHIPCICIANKIDSYIFIFLVDKSVTEKKFKFAEENNMPFYFVSAADGTNVVKVFFLFILGFFWSFEISFRIQKKSSSRWFWKWNYGIFRWSLILIFFIEIYILIFKNLYLILKWVIMKYIWFKNKFIKNLINHSIIYILSNL